ncbi:unnamed protein product [Periconia digitata]|uniref:2EXR domain-containing protein n=1 Tax=Periconia digitata TaxID=1303443 RepID=A0A9W4U8R7_9PLEO|nr:unnamed protein product [Periconia digitata]
MINRSASHPNNHQPISRSLSQALQPSISSHLIPKSNMPTKSSIFFLPKDIRLQIWALAYHNEEPRTVALSTDPHRLPSPSPAPTMYNLCHESREETRFQASLSNSLISLQQPNPNTNTNSSSPLPHLEVVFRYGVDRLLITDTQATPPRPIWADKPTLQEQRLRERDPKELIPAWQLFKTRCSESLITEMYIEVSTTRAHRTPEIAEYAADFPALETIIFTLQAFQCLSETERENLRGLARNAASTVKAKMMQSATKLDGGAGSRKRRHDGFKIDVWVCLWKQHRLWKQHQLCDLELEVWEERMMGRGLGRGFERMRLFVSCIPDFGKAMLRLEGSTHPPPRETEKGAVGDKGRRGMMRDVIPTGLEEWDGGRAWI